MKSTTPYRLLTIVTLFNFTLLPLLGALPTARAATIYTVTTNTDSGVGSFRDALTQATDDDTIIFNKKIGTIIATIL